MYDDGDEKAVVHYTHKNSQKNSQKNMAYTMMKSSWNRIGMVSFLHMDMPVDVAFLLWCCCFGGGLGLVLLFRHCLSISTINRETRQTDRQAPHRHGMGVFNYYTLHFSVTDVKHYTTQQLHARSTDDDVPTTKKNTTKCK